MSSENVEVFLQKMLKSESKEKRAKKIRTIKSQPISLDMKPLKSHVKRMPKSKILKLTKKEKSFENLTLGSNTSSSSKNSKSKRMAKKLNSTQKSGYRKIKKEDFKNVKYEDFKILNKLHGEYMENILGRFVKNSNSIGSMQEEILKMDLHGCEVKEIF